MSEPFVFGPFFDGEKQVYGDPTELNLSMLGHARGCLGQLIEDARTRGPDDGPGDTPEQRADKQALRCRADAVAIPATYKMWEIARLTFDLVPFDKSTGKGATARDCNRVLTDWFAFLAAQKKSTGASPADAPPGAAASSDAA